MTVHKDYGDLDHREALSPAPEVHLDLERVPVGPDGIELYLAQDLPMEALEATRGVPKREPRDDVRVHIGEVAQEQPPERPVDHVGAADVPRAQDDVVLAPGAKVLCKEGVLRVGRGTVVGANAVLLRSTGEGEMWAGVPAQCVGRRDDLE